MLYLLVRRRHGAFGRILVLPLLLAIAVVVVAAVVVTIVIIIVVVAWTVVAVVLVAVVLVAVETAMLVVVSVAVSVVLALLVVVLAVVVARALLLAVAALLLRSLDVGGRLLFTVPLQLDELRAVLFIFVRDGIVRCVFRLFLAGFGADFLVDFSLELKTAFQAAAAAGDILRVKRKALLLRHLYIDAVEAVKEIRAAEWAAAGADAAENGGFVTHADLTQLDADFQKAGKVAQEFAKVNASVCRELENNERLVE